MWSRRAQSLVGVGVCGLAAVALFAWRFAVVPNRVTPVPAGSAKPVTSGPSQSSSSVITGGSWQDDDRGIAVRFTPVFYQGIAGSGRLDFITNFDFDGDWIGDNNWAHAIDKRYPLKAYIYYAVSESVTHYFVHYAAYHPRDWKGGERAGRVLSGAIRETTTLGRHVQPHGLADDIVLSHENDLEGCLVVVEKGDRPSAAHVVFVETIAHDRYLKFAPTEPLGDVKPLRLDGTHPLLYAEPKGHGIHAFADQGAVMVSSSGAEESPAKSGVLSKIKKVGKVKDIIPTKKHDQPEEKKAGPAEKPDHPGEGELVEPPEAIRIYRYSGTADNPELMTGQVGYDLIPLYDTLWKLSRDGRSETFGEAHDYGSWTIKVAANGHLESRTVVVGLRGSALRGVAGAPNKARPPWGWFDISERERPLGEWFFDPATLLLRHIGVVKNWSTAYVHEPMLGVFRSPGRAGG